MCGSIPTQSLPRSSKTLILHRKWLKNIQPLTRVRAGTESETISLGRGLRRPETAKRSTVDRSESHPRAVAFLRNCCSAKQLAGQDLIDPYINSPITDCKLILPGQVRVEWGRELRDGRGTCVYCHRFDRNPLKEAAERRIRGNLKAPWLYPHFSGHALKCGSRETQLEGLSQQSPGSRSAPWVSRENCDVDPGWVRQDSDCETPSGFMFESEIVT